MKISVLKGDITNVKVDAIVNAANNSLMGGGGVDGAIHRKGGNSILEECKIIVQKQGGCPTGEAVITGAGNLPANFVIHTVGPVWKSGNQNEAQLLANCYLNVLKLAEKKSISTIAFPNISTGVYGFPKKQAAEIATETVKSYISESIKEIIFVCFDEENLLYYKNILSS